VQLHAFTNLDRAPSIAPYVAALEAFDALPQLQELKSLAREKAGLGPGVTVLDVGCGFGLESLRLARLVQPGGRVAGIDKSADFPRRLRGMSSSSPSIVTHAVIVRTRQSDPRVCARSSKRWVLSAGFTLLWYFGHAGANAVGTKRNRPP